MKDKFYQLPQEKRERMIEAGYRVFAKNEYKRASMSAIADAAGISKSLLFYYFTNKKELYLFLVNNALCLTQEVSRQYRVLETNDFFEMLWRNLKAKCSLSVKYPYISVFSLKAYYEQNPEVKKDVSRLIDKENQMGRQEFLESMDHSLFREEIDLKMMVQEITLACEGYLYPLGHTASHTLRVGVLRTIRYTHRASRISYPTGGRATHDKVYPQGIPYIIPYGWAYYAR